MITTKYYHNTTGQAGEYLTELMSKAKTQDEAVLAVFKAENKPLSPSMIYRKYGQGANSYAIFNCPITSIRRAISNLTRAGKLVKTSLQVQGMYGCSSLRSNV